MSEHWIILIISLVALVGMYVAYRWGYEVASQDHLDMIADGRLFVGKPGDKLIPVSMPSPRQAIHRQPPPGWSRNMAGAARVRSEIINAKMISGEINLEEAAEHVAKGEITVNQWRDARHIMEAKEAK